MSTSVSSATSSTSTTNQSTTTDAYDSLDTEFFLKLLVSEMQNQDPLEPMDSSKIVEQIASIRAIVSNDKLSNTLGSVLLGQNVNTATGLIGKTVTGLNSSSNTVTGTVDRVEVADGEVTLYVGNDAISLSNISEIEGEGSSDSSSGS